jgi:hypothetical protein
MKAENAIRVLHLDDTPHQSSVVELRRKLRANRCKLDEAVTLDSAVRLLRKKRYDCLISDLVKGDEVTAMEFQEMLDYAQADPSPLMMAVFSNFLGDWRCKEEWERKGVRSFAKDRIDDLVASVTVNWCHRFRGLWRTIRRDNLPARTSLAVIQGIVERSSRTSLSRAYEWLRNTYEGLAAGTQPDPQELEAQARTQNCDLQVFDPQRDPVAVIAFFGVIGSVEEGVADVSLYVREATQRAEDPVLEAIEVPVVDLPLPYVVPGVWVAWVERKYQDGSRTLSKGRFEPASALPAEADPQVTVIRSRVRK